MGMHPAISRFTLPFVDGALRLGADDTDGGFSMLEMSMAPNSGPEAHVHTDTEEYFYVLAGTYAFRCGDEVFPAAPGDVVTVPRGVVHQITAGPEGGRHLTLFRPAGPEGWFVEADRLHRAGVLTPEAVGALYDRYRMVFPGGGVI